MMRLTAAFRFVAASALAGAATADEQLAMLDALAVVARRARLRKYQRGAARAARQLRKAEQAQLRFDQLLQP